MDGITDASLGGALSGYGLYADNVYLKGKMVLSAGSSISFNDVTGTSGLETKTGAQTKATAALTSAKADATTKSNAAQTASTRVANAAQITANTAKTNAAIAQTTANSGVTKANTAQTKANSALHFSGNKSNKLAKQHKLLRIRLQRLISMPFH